ncbi:MAG: hypothetical protein ACXWZ7_10585 [Gemmatirosa sp.]
MPAPRLALLASLTLAACQGDAGPAGPTGTTGPAPAGPGQRLVLSGRLAANDGTSSAAIRTLPEGLTLSSPPLVSC